MNKSQRSLITVSVIVLAIILGSAQAGRYSQYARVNTHWKLNHDPAVNVIATVTQAAGGVGVVHVLDCVTATFVAGTTAPAAVVVTVVARDGASGAGTIIWSGDFALPATAGASAPPIQACGLHIPGTTNTAMTVEFTAAGGVNTFETVAATGYDR